MKVRDVMSTKIFTITPETTYEEAAKMLIQNRHSGFPVVDQAGNIVGILSEKNLFRAMYPKYEDFMSNPEAFVFRQEDREAQIRELRHQPVAEFMHAEVATIEPDAPILRAGGIMLARNYYRLPVVENGRLVGLITREQIFGNILKTQLGL